MKNRFPDWIVPMAATLTQERFTGSEWSFERKFDGIRLLAYKKGKQVQLFSRNRLPQNIPAISQAIAKLPHRELILDGEITWHAPFSYHVFDILWLDGRETMSLPLEERRALLQRLPFTAPLRRVTELNVSEPPAVASGPNRRGSSPTVKEGVSVPGAIATGSSDNPDSRGSSPSVREGVSVLTGSNSPWEYAREHGWEGVIAKRRGSAYEQRRSRNWLKMKCELAQEFVVGGFTDPQGKRVGLGALLVGYYESEPPASAVGSQSRGSSPKVSEGVSEPGTVARTPNRGSSPTVREGSRKPDSDITLTNPDTAADFIYAGKIGTGFNNELLLDLRRKFDALEIPKAPFTRAVGLPRLRAHWVRPEIVVQVGFIQWTGHGKLRHPRLLGVRTDKDAREVVRES